MTFIASCSGHLRRPALLTGHVISPALEAAGEVFSMGDQNLVQLAGEHWDAFTPAWCLNQWQVMQTLRLRVLSSTASSR